MYTATPNRLIREKSPYLLQHAFNPVDWFPWGPAAFDKARAEDKPIFLSIGYSTCHWCHVMERESFESAEIAAVLNGHFVAIKVDREERPDVDRVYMLVTQALTGGGGWPMTVFLTPDLKPFFAGTYFPPDSAYGRPGFLQLLKAIQRGWAEGRPQLLASAERLTEALSEHVAASHAGTLEGTQVFADALDAFAAQYDPAHGGFGGAPKFPRPATLLFLLREHARSGDGRALDMALGTLRAMAAGGMRDHLGGGFHRYSTDERWHVPHFEKMLYDQAQLATAYLEAFQVSGDAALADVARETLDYVLRDLTSTEGAFFSAEDADSASADNPRAHVEGAFYVWTANELGRLLGGDAELFGHVYGVNAEGNALADPHGEFVGKNILHLARTPAQAAAHFALAPADVDARLARSRARLLQARGSRPRPHLDDKIVTSWNGLTITALARAAQVLGEPRYHDAAVRAAEFLLHAVLDANSGELARRFRDGEAGMPGQLDDYAFVAQGLLDLYEAGFETRWLDAACRLTEKQIELFWDEAHGGFFETTGRDASILWRMKDGNDAAEPAGNSVAAQNLMRLAQMLDRPAWAGMARRTFAAFTELLKTAPTALPQMIGALIGAHAAPRQIVVSGARERPEVRALLHEVHRRFIPNKVVLLADGGADQQWLGERLEFVRGLKPDRKGATAYVCEHFVCKAPVHEPAALSALLDT